MATKGEDRIDPELLRELGQTEDELNREFEEARKRGEERARTEPRAVAARYDAATRRIAIDLQNGSTFIFPVELGQGIAGSSDEDLAKVEVVQHGYALHWENLDADLAVPGLLAGVFGGTRWIGHFAVTAANWSAVGA